MSLLASRPRRFMVNNADPAEVAHHMKRAGSGGYRAAAPNNMIPLNMLHKPYIQNGGPYPGQPRSGVKGVRSMGPRTLHPQHEEHPRLLPHQVSGYRQREKGDKSKNLW